MSNLETFNTQITGLITSLVLTPLSEWLNNDKNVNVSVDELLDVLKIPKPSKTSMSSLAPVFTTTTANIPPVKSDTTSRSSSALKTSTAPVNKPKSKPPSPENYTGATCKYVFKRGDLKGKECGKPVVSGTDFCEHCSSKKGNKSADAKQTKIVETKTGNSRPTAQTTVGFTTSIAKKTEKPKIELRETGQPNTYIDIQTNIVVKKVVEKDKTFYVAVGVQEETGFRTLTEDEKKEALNRNFSLSTSDIKENVQDKKIVAKQPVSNIPDIESDDE